jgi:hypothetical protein
MDGADRQPLPGVCPSASPDGPTRARVLAYVNGLIAAHRLAFVTPRSWTVGRRGAIDQLTKEHGLMLATGEHGDALVKTWALLTEGRDGLFAAVAQNSAWGAGVGRVRQDPLRLSG